jgi:hypothetical protein
VTGPTSPRRAAELAEAVYRNGSLDEAWRLTEIAEVTGGDDDIPTQFFWRSVRGKLLACDGRAAEAEDLAREAVALAEATDALSLRGRSCSTWPTCSLEAVAAPRLRQRRRRLSTLRAQGQFRRGRPRSRDRRRLT